MKIENTQRGFAYIDFIDFNNKKCSIQKSSIATKDLIWLGVDNSDPANAPRMHLTQDQVKKLLPYLQRFVATGEISSREDLKAYTEKMRRKKWEGSLVYTSELLDEIRQQAIEEYKAQEAQKALEAREKAQTHEFDKRDYIKLEPGIELRNLVRIGTNICTVDREYPFKGCDDE